MTLRRFGALVLLCVVVLTGTVTGPQASATPSAAGGTTAGTIEVGGLQRTYLLHAPAHLSANPGLVIMLHGGFGSAQQAELSYGWDTASNLGGFVVAFPDGLNHVWNAGGCCGVGARDTVDDVAFIAGLVARLQQEFNIPPDRTFATGMSNGAMMAYRLACHTTLFASMASVAGTLVEDCQRPAPISVLEIHGTADSEVRMDGEPGSGPAHVDGMPVRDVVDVFRQADGCARPLTWSSGTVTREVSMCGEGRRVTLITLEGGGHEWPGGWNPQPRTEPSSATINATAEICRFFRLA